MQSIRTFIAIDLPDSLRRELADVQQRLRACGADVRWSRVENIHLTLAFIGRTAIDRLPQLTEEMDRQLNGCQPFQLEIQGLGTFGKPGSPRVIWAGVRLDPMLSAVHNLLQQALGDLGFPPDPKPYFPHLTLGRVRSKQSVERLLDAVPQEKDTAQKTVPVNEVVLYESRLRHGGPDYIPLHRTTL